VKKCDVFALMKNKKIVFKRVEKLDQIVRITLNA